VVGRSPARTPAAATAERSLPTAARAPPSTAIVEFPRAYAEQNERDYRELVAAVESGRIIAETGF
jgi:hypothetical protein